jgi:hypothetical protein
MKYKTMLKSFFIALVAMIITIGCKKDTQPNNKVTVEITGVQYNLLVSHLIYIGNDSWKPGQDYLKSEYKGKYTVSFKVNSNDKVALNIQSTEVNGVRSDLTAKITYKDQVLLADTKPEFIVQIFVP